MANGDPKKHIRFTEYSQNEAYRYPKQIHLGFKVKQQARNIHGNQILEQLESIKQQFDLPDDVTLPPGIVRDDAIYVEFTSEWGYEIKFESLEQDRDEPKFQILNIHEERRIVETREEYRYKVTLMITEGGITSFIKKVREYLTKNTLRKDRETGIRVDTGNPRNGALVNNIQRIQLATLRSFWTDAPEIPFPNEGENIWWEVWFRRTSADEEKLNNVFQNLRLVGAEIGESEILFAEHRVRLVRGTAIQLSASLLLLDNLAELRRPQETADFISHKDVTHTEQAEWLTELVRRTEAVINEQSVLICLLDSGVNNQHPLVAPFLPDDRMYSYRLADWGTYDGWPDGGHGTGMAGLSLYGDMVDAISGTHQIRIFHGIESFKILQDNDPNDPELYGAITEFATSTPLVDRPETPRVFCLSVTDKHLAFKGRPSAWSAAIDKIAFGSAFIPISPQLFIVSGGNVVITIHSEFPAKNLLESIHDPGQAYNAITVGSYTRKDRIDPTTGYTHLAQNGSMAPSNSTSTLWDHQWPLKPDIVLEGGNYSTDGTNTSDHPSLKLLTSDKDYPRFIFLPFGDTSAAASLAAKMAAEIKTRYPEFWPETVRGLMIHSAEWTPTMLERRRISDLNEQERINLLRSVGYGVPILEKAINSANNSLTLIAERTIQPYKLVATTPKYNEYHLFELPWPTDILRGALFDQDVTIKVTLSYFIEPNPGSRRYANNFQYHSHALDFSVIKPAERLAVFKRRISSAIEIPEDERDGTEEEWNIKRVRSRGSVKKDFITMSGADIAARNIIAVYPKNGWYRTRKKLARAESVVRYSLIVTIETPIIDVDIYTPVLNQIGTRIDIQI